MNTCAETPVAIIHRFAFLHWSGYFIIFIKKISFSSYAFYFIRWYYFRNNIYNLIQTSIINNLRLSLPYNNLA